MNTIRNAQMPSPRTSLILFPFVLMGLCFAPAPATGTSRLDLTVTYTGPEEIDAEHPISVLLFDGPDLSGGSRMVAAGHVTRNGEVLSLSKLPDTVYIAAIYDPLGNFTGLSGIIPGSVIGVYAPEGEQGPAPVEVGKRTKLKFEFDDAQRIPGDPDMAVPKAVREAEEGILEIRKYTVKKGMREKFIEFFEDKTLEPQEKAGLRVIGQFRSLENEDQFVWIRTYASQKERAEQLREFYLGPDWIDVQDEAGQLIANTEVMLVAPTARSEIR
jgi:hypothetical protein